MGQIVGYKFFGKLNGRGHRTYLESMYLDSDADRIEVKRTERVYRRYEGDYIIGDKDMEPIYAI